MLPFVKWTFPPLHINCEPILYFKENIADKQILRRLRWNIEIIKFNSYSHLSVFLGAKLLHIYISRFFSFGLFDLVNVHIFLEGCSISYFGRASTNVLDHLRPPPSLCPYMWGKKYNIFYMYIIRIADGGSPPLIGDMSLKKSITLFTPFLSRTPPAAV